MARRAPLPLLGLAALLIAAPCARAVRGPKDGEVIPPPDVNAADAPSPLDGAAAAAPAGAAAAGAPVAPATVLPTGRWLSQNVATPVGPYAWIRRFSPTCPTNQAAAACGSYSGNTAVVVNGVSPNIGATATVGTARNCICDWRNTINSQLQGVLFRCMVFCV